MRPTTPILLALALTLPTIAQTPTLKVYSRETIVDVTVTDAKGNPVHGLKKEDFTLKEDNKPQPIRSFEEFGTQPIPPPPKLPPNVYTNLQPPPASGAINILLLDGINTAPVYSLTHPDGPEDLNLARGAQHLVQQEAKKYLATMPLGTRAAALGMSKGLRILQGVTSDADLLSAAIDTMDYNVDGMADSAEQYCAQSNMRNRMTLEVLNQIAADASAIKGKKNLIWFSIGVPNLNNPSKRTPCLPDYKADLLKTYGLLTAAQIAVYPVDARGVPPIPSYDASPPEMAAFYKEVGTEQLAMETWAEETGGAAFYNSNDLAKLMGKAIDKGSNYYTLSYVPPGKKYDYGHHTIKIAVDQPGLHLVYRNTYDAVDPATIKPPPGLALATTMPESEAGDIRAAMSRSMPTSTQILFTVEVDPTTTPPKPTDPPIFGTLDPKLVALSISQKGKLTRYDIAYAIPARQLTFTNSPDGATHKLSLDFDIAAYDGDGHLVTSLSQTIAPTLTPDQHQQLLKGPFRFFQQLDLPPGALFLRIGILDPTSNKTGTLEIPLTVPRK